MIDLFYITAQSSACRTLDRTEYQITIAALTPVSDLYSAQSNTRSFSNTSPIITEMHVFL